MTAYFRVVSNQRPDTEYEAFENWLVQTNHDNLEEYSNEEWLYMLLHSKSLKADPVQREAMARDLLRAAFSAGVAHIDFRTFAAAYRAAQLNTNPKKK